MIPWWENGSWYPVQRGIRPQCCLIICMVVVSNEDTHSGWWNGASSTSQTWANRKALRHYLGTTSCSIASENHISPTKHKYGLSSNLAPSSLSPPQLFCLVTLQSNLGCQANDFLHHYPLGSFCILTWNSVLTHRNGFSDRDSWFLPNAFITVFFKLLITNPANVCGVLTTCQAMCWHWKCHWE